MYQLRSANLTEALQEPVVANIGQQETDLLVKILRLVYQPREVKQGDGDIVLRYHEKQVVEHPGEDGLLFFGRLCVPKTSRHLIWTVGKAGLPGNRSPAFGG